MTIISFISIFIGSCALALIISIMNGFEKTTHDQLQGIHAQIIMQSDNNELDYATIKSILQAEFPTVQAVSGCSYKQVLVQKKDDHEGTHAVLLKAIDPSDEEETTVIGHKIVQSPKKGQSFASLFDQQSIIIGKKLATALHINLGDSITLLYIPESTNENQIRLQQKKALISGIFSTGIDEVDNNLIFASFSFMHDLFPTCSVTHINLKLKKAVDEKKIIEQLKNRFHLDVFSWKDLYPALVSALTLEKYAMFFILSLIVLIACMNIISLMFMHILKKRIDIAILQSLGMKKMFIIKLFLSMGMLITALASGCGLLCAYLIGLLLQRYPFINLPDSYYTATLPIHMEATIFLSLFILIMAMGLIASWFPCKNIKSMHTAHLLKLES